MIISGTNNRLRQKGLATVELALITPVLLIMVMMTAEFTRAFYQFNTLNKSVRDAARYLSINAINPAKVVDISAHAQQTRNLAAFGSINGGTPVLPGLAASDINIEVVDMGTGIEPKPHVRVSVTYDFQPIGPVLSGMFFLGQDTNMEFQLTARSTMVAI